MSDLSNKVKSQTEDMLYQLLKYISVSGLSDDDEYELKIELACTIITSSIPCDFDDITGSMKELEDALLDVSSTSLKGFSDVLLSKRGYKET